MSGETDKDQSGFSVDTALVLVNQRFADLNRLLDERHMAQQAAVEAALQTAQREIVRTNLEIKDKFTTVNEFRGQLDDYVRNLMTRSESEVVHRELAARMGRMEDRLNGIDTLMAATQGVDKGVVENAAARRATVAQLIALAAVFLTAISVAVGLILALNG